MNNFQNTDYTDTGFLRVNVTGFDRVTPLDGATVRITDRDDTFVVDELRTDSSGMTPVVELSAPPEEYSEEAGYNKPYSEYNVTVTAKDFSEFRVKGVQILPTCNAEQTCVLTPPPTTSSDTVFIDQNTLWGMFPPKIEEDPVKPLPNDNGLVILPEPVIPAFVTVHLGTPSNTSARNVSVPFIDYIKNVACCEIYATWPEETLKANIIAIISLTLNRVYTEWYRSKGYDFTITNSTAYDQAFSPDRNIFDEISVVVDDVFTTYITQPGIAQPLFAQYCDGKRVQCAVGMHQWGSKSLGDQGYSAIQILRRYYGASTYFKEAARVEGVPQSYGGSPLSIGSSGQPVRVVQSQLNSIANNYPAIGKVAVDGIYGQATADSVRTFQRVFSLPVTGVVDFATWYQLSYIYTAENKLAEPPAR